MGRATMEALKMLVAFVEFFGQLMVSMWELVRNPRLFRVNAVSHQFEVVGVNAPRIIGLMSFLIGIVIDQQGAVKLRQLGAEVFAITLLDPITLRKTGVLSHAYMEMERAS